MPAAVDEAPGEPTCCGRKGTQNGIVIDSGSKGLCKRLVKEAWGVRPSVPAMDKHLARGRRRGGRRTIEREELESALGIRVTSAFFQIALSFRLVLKASEVWLRKPVRKGEVWPMGDRSPCSDSDFF